MNAVVQNSNVIGLGLHCSSHGDSSLSMGGAMYLKLGRQRSSAQGAIFLWVGLMPTSFQLLFTTRTCSGVQGRSP